MDFSSLVVAAGMLGVAMITMPPLPRPPKSFWIVPLRTRWLRSICPCEVCREARARVDPSAGLTATATGPNSAKIDWSWPERRPMEPESPAREPVWSPPIQRDRIQWERIQQQADGRTCRTRLRVHWTGSDVRQEIEERCYTDSDESSPWEPINVTEIWDRHEINLYDPSGGLLNRIESFNLRS